MKRNFVVIVLMFMITGVLSAQSCISDAYTYMRNDQIFQAKTKIDNCFAANQDNADMWLLRGNVYYFLYKWEGDRVAKGNVQGGKVYVRKFPDAIFTAEESFKKVISLKKDAPPKSGMYDALTGQILCAYPIYEIGVAARSAKNYEDAFKYILMAAENYKLEKDKVEKDKKSKEYSYFTSFMSILYLDLADLSRVLANTENYKRYTRLAVNVNAPDPAPYLWMYDIYRADNDTANCKAMIELCLKNVPDTNRKELSGYQLDYYGMIGDVAHINVVADSILTIYGNKPEIIAMVVGHLVNHKQYEKTEAILNKGLSIAPNDFILNYQMGFRHYSEAVDFKELADAANANKNFQEGRKWQEKQKACMENAYPWIEKAYQSNSEDKQNNIMLYQLGLMLGKTLPEGLKAKVESYEKR